MAAPSKKAEVELGFVEKTDSWRLLSHFFPNKVGGKVAWLALKDLPSYEDTKCRICEKPCVFLLQVYAPVNELDTCFHRTVFVFICKDPACCQKGQNLNLRIFRSQLPKNNEFYSEEPPNYEQCPSSSSYPKADDYLTMCLVCGLSGPKRCGKCHKSSYCCKEHQTIDWKSGHKHSCGQEKASSNGSDKWLFPEYELVTEVEEDGDEEDEKTEEVKMKEYNEYMKKLEPETGVKGKNVDKDLEKMASGEDIEDKQFMKFKERISHEPDQIMRYQRGGVPLWISSEGVPKDEDIPNCSCGSSRQFEFQILPQLLTHLDVDSLEQSIDWGTLAVYTCQNNCDEQLYNEEWVHKQDLTESKGKK